MGNVEDVVREKDILFRFRRINQKGNIILLGVDEYACSISLVRCALEDFGSLNFICVGGLWNGYTERAKEFCMEKHIGLYNTSELSGGLWKDDYWDYTQKKEIVSIIIKANVQAVYGFGSFFRDSSFSDVDIIIVSKESENNLVNLHRQLCGLLGEISSSIQLRIDFTLLTEDEFSSVQLRERNRLIKMT